MQKVAEKSVNTKARFNILKIKKLIIVFCIPELLIIFLIGCTANPTQSIPPRFSNTPITQPLPALTPTAVASENPDNLSRDQISTLSSLQKVDGYPRYTMHYQGYLPGINQGTQKNDPNLDYQRTALSQPDWGCSLFTSFDENSNYTFGRNFDWEYSPGLLLFTDPPDGYASASMVDITYLGFEAEDFGVLHEMEEAELTPLLDAPN